CARGAGTYW
nr:immunoglobulin heavy chain junction region [Mus musculus]NSM04508.1 immunoglobulin heavy chain junction region [Mus musculus]NSM04863.1 immunoglobulin heavy chain junction region [Mus musculus]NSM04876.1 immunoglobulin heavy chain junction region [Mus musculus]NSM05017.1 immunoglobulin heavy chain junction region [Mus musculus]